MESIGRWEPKKEHHGSQFLEGKQTTSMEPSSNQVENKFTLIILLKLDYSTVNKYLCESKEACMNKLEEVKKNYQEKGIDFSSNYEYSIEEKEDIKNIDNPNEYIANSQEDLTKTIGEEHSKALIEIQKSQATKELRILEYSRKTYEENKKDLQYYIDRKESLNIEDEVKKESEKADIERAKINTEKINNIVKDVSNNANKMMADMNVAIASISNNVEEGSEYVIKQVKSAKESAINKIKQLSRKKVTEAKENIESECKTEGNNKGMKLAEEYNKLLEDKANAMVSLKNKTTSKAKAKAEAALQKAKLAIMALTGISL